MQVTIQRKTYNTGQLVTSKGQFRKLARKLEASGWEKEETTTQAAGASLFGNMGVEEIRFKRNIDKHGQLMIVGNLQEEEGSVLYRFSCTAPSATFGNYQDLLIMAYPQKNHSRNSGIYTAVLNPTMRLVEMLEHAKDLYKHLIGNDYLEILRRVGNGEVTNGAIIRLLQADRAILQTMEKIATRIPNETGQISLL
jgi:hypothetical protein